MVSEGLPMVYLTDSLGNTPKTNVNPFNILKLLVFNPVPHEDALSGYIPTYQPPYYKPIYAYEEDAVLRLCSDLSELARKRATY